MGNERGLFAPFIDDFAESTLLGVWTTATTNLRLNNPASFERLGEDPSMLDIVRHPDNGLSDECRDQWVAILEGNMSSEEREFLNAQERLF